MQFRIRWFVSLLLELFVAIAVPLAWGALVFRQSDGALMTARGLNTLKYFTVLSNLLAGAASLLTVVWLLRGAKTGGRLPRWLVVLRITAAACVMLTFLTVAAFLGPLFGYAAMFGGPSLWLHLFIPLASAAGVLLLRGDRMARRELLWCLAPVGAYAVFYLGNILIHGIGTRPQSNDWYNLLNWGWGVGLVLFAGLLCFVLGSAAALRLGYHATNTKKG